MPTEVQVFMPKLGMTMSEGTVVEWYKRAGDAVAKGEPLVAVETDKATVEIEAPYSGTLAKRLVLEGTDVPCGEAIGVIVTSEVVDGT